jgi:hypothetical protein
MKIEAACIAILILIFGFSAYAQNSSEINVTIESPKEYDSVNSTVLVRGIISPSITADEYIWIAVRPLASFNNYWPQSGGPLNDSIVKGKFSGVAYLGGSSGQEFEIAVLVLNKTLNDIFSEWISVCTRQNDWPPITDTGHNYSTVKKDTIQSHINDSKWVKLK